MNNTITVKGIGKYSAKPDVIILTLKLNAQDMTYENAIIKAETQIEQLRSAIRHLGFEKEQLKTTNFSVDSCYENRKKSNEYVSIFVGYKITHNLKLEFDLDTKLLARILSAIASCGSDPELHIIFGIKDKDAVCTALLEEATKNAAEKAAILTRASGVKLGQLISIDYNWSEISLVSNTEYVIENCCEAAPTGEGIDIEPDDIDVRDTVTFVWQIA